MTYPFHAVRGSDLAEHCVVVEDSSVGSVRELTVVRRSTEVLLARKLCERVEARGGRADGGGRGGVRGTRHAADRTAVRGRRDGAASLCLDKE